jgi:hypothetical protein
MAMYWTLAVLGLVGLVIGSLFKVQVLVVVSLVAAMSIFGEGVVDGAPILKAVLHTLAGLAVLQASYVVGVVVSAWAFARPRLERVPQETTN